MLTNIKQSGLVFTAQELLFYPIADYILWPSSDLPGACSSSPSSISKAPRLCSKQGNVTAAIRVVEQIVSS